MPSRSPTAGLAADTGLARGLERLGTLACPIAPNPILALPNDANGAEAAACVGDTEPEVLEEELRSPSDTLVLNCDTPGNVEADQISPPPPPPLPDPDELLATTPLLPRGGEDVIQLDEDVVMLALLVEGADQVSLAPKIDDMVLELKGGSPPVAAEAAGAFAPGAELRPAARPGAGPKLSMLGS